MIKVEAISKRFAGRDGHDVPALDDVTFDVQAGELVLVIGPSGSGKSTLLYTVGGMLAPTAGTVRLGELNVYGLSGARRAQLRQTRLGFVFQTFNLVPFLSCVENVALPAILAGKSGADSRSAARASLERLGLGPRLKHRPAELSVGERQRVALCRALINKPDVLLADEPTGNLDPDSTNAVMELLLELNAAGQTILIVTHDHALAQRGRRVLALRDGRIDAKHSRDAEAAA